VSVDRLDWPADLLVLIPVYNHGRTVGQVAAAAQALGAPVLVVDDGSSDGSGAAARAAGVEVIAHEHNRGKAAALWTGFRWAWQRGYRRVLTVDADGQHPVSELPAMVVASQAEPQALILGRRDMSVAPWPNRWGRWCSNMSVWSTCGRWPGDSQTGLRVYPLAGILPLPLLAGGYTFEIEVLVRAVWHGLRLRPIPVQVIYPADRVSHFRRCRDNLRAIRSWCYLLARACLPLPQRLRELPGEEPSAH
jgi:glycosyltransferase involved in cell wall biosynthesis